MSTQALSVERFADDTLEDAQSFASTFGVTDVISGDRFDSWAEARGRYCREDADHVAKRNQLRVKIIPALQRAHGMTLVTQGPESYQLQTLEEGLKIAANRFPQSIKRVNETKSKRLKRTAGVLEAHGVENNETRLLLNIVGMIADHSNRQGELSASLAESMLGEVRRIQETERKLLGSADPGTESVPS